MNGMNISDKEKAMLLKAQLSAVQSAITQCFEEIERIYGTMEAPYDSVGEEINNINDTVWNAMGERMKTKSGYLSGNH